MKLSLSEVMEATGAVAGPAVAASAFSGWSIDSRTVNAGDLYIALRGEHFDGHAFVRDAYAKGAAAAMVDGSTAEDGPYLHVDSCPRALGKLACTARRKWGHRLVAVTGSAGKTGTKDAIAALLAKRLVVAKTAGNLNNHLGLPLTLLRIPETANIAVVEMGMNHAGEIRALAEIARPEIGVVTNVGYAHIEAFESIEGIAAAKRELIEGLPQDGTAVLNADDARVAGFGKSFAGAVVTYGLGAAADLRATEVRCGPQGASFTAGGVGFHTKLTGAHSISNLLAALAVAQVCGIALHELADAVAELTPGKMRGGRRKLRGITVFDDSYNSNPEAARSMLRVLAEEPSAGRRIAVLGEMLELGRWSEELHRDLGGYAAAQGVDVFVGIGGEAARTATAEAGKKIAAYYFPDSAAAGEFLRTFTREGDAVLFKGSRGIAVEQALARIEESN